MTRIAIDTAQVRELASLMRGAAAEFDAVAVQLVSEEDLWSVPPEARGYVADVSRSIASRVREVAGGLAAEAGDLEWRAAALEHPGGPLPNVWLDLSADFAPAPSAPSSVGGQGASAVPAAGLQGAQYGVFVVGGDGTIPPAAEGGTGTLLVGGTDLFGGQQASGGSGTFVVGGTGLVESGQAGSSAGLFAVPNGLVIGGTDPGWFPSPGPAAGTMAISGPAFADATLDPPFYGEILGILASGSGPGVGTTGDLAFGIMSHINSQAYFRQDVLTHAALDSTSPTYDQTYREALLEYHGYD